MRLNETEEEVKLRCVWWCWCVSVYQVRSLFLSSVGSTPLIFAMIWYRDTVKESKLSIRRVLILHTQSGVEGGEGRERNEVNEVK